MPRLAWALVIWALLTTRFDAQQLSPRQRKLSAKAATIQPEACEGDIHGFRDCHARYPMGCTAQGRYDGYLSYLKNQMPGVNSIPKKYLAESDFQALDRRTPGKLRNGNHAFYAKDLFKLGEGNVYALIGYLYNGVRAGREACNCQLAGDQDVDLHIEVGFDPDLAQGIREGTVTDRRQWEPKSIVVEMTPEYRARFHPKWSTDLLDQARGRQVAVFGQLLADNQYNNKKYNCAYPAAQETCWRKSIWELHPVIQFFVCNSESPCSKKPAGWVKLDDWKP